MANKKPPEKRRHMLAYDYEPARRRLLYLCELMFGGDGYEMARALNICYRDLSMVFHGHTRTSVRFIAHVSACLNVRAEWLLCGVGNIFRTPYETDGLQLPVVLQSAFPLFDTKLSTGNLSSPIPNQDCADAVVTSSPAYMSAGRALYEAKISNKLTGFFLGADSFSIAGAAQLKEFYTAGFVEFLGLTLSAAKQDAANFCHPGESDLNTAAKFAASRGIGYGEALALMVATSERDSRNSLLTTANSLAVPVSVAVEFGEIVEHTAPSLGGAELGAMLGAAAYVDLLVLTEQLKSFFGSPGGVLLFAGEYNRCVRLVLQRIESLRAFVEEPAGFTFVIFAVHDSNLETFIHKHGGHVIFLDPPTTAAFAKLFQTCADVYAGKISHDHNR